MQMLRDHVLYKNSEIKQVSKAIQNAIRYYESKDHALDHEFRAECPICLLQQAETILMGIPET